MEHLRNAIQKLGFTGRRKFGVLIWPKQNNFGCEDKGPSLIFERLKTGIA